jgi:predicted enzyme related to lactoylglutathione lyase
MDNPNNRIVWCDIPAKDLDRSIKFYGAVLGETIEKQTMPGMEFAAFAHENGVGGCLFAAGEVQPSAQGPLVYLNCQGRLDEAAAAVEPNGGQLLQPKHQIGPYGFRVVVLDSEGNRIALHSR